MWKYLSLLIFIMLIVLVIGFVRNNYYNNAKSPLHTELQLAASFAEIRSDHFHMGVDIRTNGKENLPVYAIEDGFVSRVKIEPYGYGKAIFLQHPDGKTSVYAHLNHFTDSLEAFVKRQQYATQSWQQDVVCAAGQFPVKKGELIAYSGNTGNSEGPHLHFELRDTRTGKNLNPALYGFAVRDHTPPLVEGLYWYDRRYSTYEQSPTAIAITGKEGEYRSKKKLVRVSSPVISLGMRAEDRVDGSRFRYGLYRARVWLDGKLVYEMVLNNFSDADSRYVNACFDYSYRIRTGLQVQHLSRLPGNRLPVYKGGDGLINLADTMAHRVCIQVADAAGNTADIDLALQRSNYDPVMHDLAAGTHVLMPGRAHLLRIGCAEVQFDKNAFYDTVPFIFTSKKNASKKNGGRFAASAVVRLHKPTVPVHSKYRVKIKTWLKSGDPLRQRAVMQFTGFKNKTVIKGVWEGDYMCGFFDELGTVQLLIDTIAPAVERQGETKPGTAITITAKDNLGGISGFRAELDGRWILFEQKAGVFTYFMDEKCEKGRHDLQVWVTDVAGNRVSKRFSFVKE